MANFTATIAKGRSVELFKRVKTADPANAAFVVLLLSANEADAALGAHDDVAAMLAAAGNTEATFTNYTRKTLVAADLASLPAPDDVADERTYWLPKITWANAGGTVDNTLTRALVCFTYDVVGGGDATLEPMLILNYPVTTSGGNIDLEFPANLYTAKDLV